MKTRYLLIVVSFLALVCTGASASSMPSPLAPPPRTVAQYEEEIRAYFARDEWDYGKQVLDRAIKKYPSASPMNELMGQYYLHYKEYDNARFFLIRALRINDDNVKARYMLVQVEENTGNYSSAICYVNELLEGEPYDKGLWYKKASLYRRQGNEVEADRLLERLQQIFPEDTAIRRQYMNRLEENYGRAASRRNDADAEQALRTLIAKDPYKASYYHDLCNLYIRQGNKAAAIQAAEEGIFTLHGNVALAKKKVSILAEQHRYNEAISFVRDYERVYGGGLGNLKHNIEEEAAMDAVRNDPYTQQARLYDRTHNKDALTYLINTSFVREYNEDALHYIGEALKTQPGNVRYLYMEHIVYKRMGYRSKSIATLRRAHEIEPANQDVINDLSFYYMQDASDQMEMGEYAEALPYLDFIIENDTTTETYRSAINRKLVCLTNLRRYNQALALLNVTGQAAMDEKSFHVRQANMLAADGREDEALRLLEGVADKYGIEESYEEIALLYVKKLIEQGAIRKAHSVTHRLLTMCPNSKEALMQRMTTCGLLHKDREFAQTVRRARELYPDDIDILVKQVAVYNNNQDYHSSLNLLRPLLVAFPLNQVLIGANSATADLLAMNLMKDHRGKDAILVIDSALRHDPLNRNLLYDKGVAFEKLKIYDSAYYYQRYYRPNDMEMSNFAQHSKGLLYDGAANEIAVSYLRSRYGGDNPNFHALASAGYSHKEGGNTYGMAVNYAGRDAADSITHIAERGGTGFQFVGSWIRVWNEKTTTHIDAGLSTRYFPKLQANLRVERYLYNGWTTDVHAGYRNVATSKMDGALATDTAAIWNSTYKNLFNLGVGVGKDLHPFYVGGKVDGLLLADNFYFNASVQGRYLVCEDNVSSLMAQFAIGTAPEAEVIDRGLPATFDHLNTSVGLGVTYLFTGNLSGMLMGSWQTFYISKVPGGVDFYGNPLDTEAKYKNIFNLFLQLNIHF